MTHCFKEIFALVNTANATTPEIEYLNFTAEKIDDYVKEFPMPESITYSNFEELKKDLLGSRGMLTLNKDENEDFVEWLTELVYFCN